MADRIGTNTECLLPKIIISQALLYPTAWQISKNALDCFNIKKIIFIGRKKLDEIELDDEWKGISNPKIVFKPKKTGFFGLFKS